MGAAIGQLGGLLTVVSRRGDATDLVACIVRGQSEALNGYSVGLRCGDGDRARSHAPGQTLLDLTAAGRSSSIPPLQSEMKIPAFVLSENDAHIQLRFLWRLWGRIMPCLAVKRLNEKKKSMDIV